jgi:hypothetical protein
MRARQTRNPLANKIPRNCSGHSTCESVVVARARHCQLAQSSSPTRFRLDSHGVLDISLSGDEDNLRALLTSPPYPTLSRLKVNKKPSLLRT